MIKFNNIKLLLSRLKDYHPDDRGLAESLEVRLRQHMRLNPIMKEERALPGEFRLLRLKTAAVLAVLAIMIFALGGGAVLATQNSLPGDRLYGVKLAGEELKMSFIKDPEVKIRAYNAVFYERIKELEAVLNRAEAGAESPAEYDKKLSLVLGGLGREFEEINHLVKIMAEEPDTARYQRAEEELKKSARVADKIFKENLADEEDGKKLMGAGNLAEVLKKIEDYQL